MKKAIIFDMDGLMIDSERVIYHYYSKVLKEKGYPFSLDLYKTFLGKNRLKVMSLLVENYGPTFPVQEIWDLIHYEAQEHFKREVPVKEGLIELLTYLKANNYKTIVATSSDRWRVDEILASAKLTSYFDDIICGNEVKNGKPHPEIFLSACEKLNVSTEEALVLEDSETGILAAYNANIDCICVVDIKYPDKEYASKPLYIFNSLYDVLDYLKGENND